MTLNLTILNQFRQDTIHHISCRMVFYNIIILLKYFMFCCTTLIYRINDFYQQLSYCILC